jgi:plasmid maintenance system antidote protein VapI
MADSSDTLRAQIQAAVKASGLKQIWIAERLGVSQKHLSQMLLGRVVLTLDWAQRIASVCGHRVTVTVAPVEHHDDCPACARAKAAS